MGQCFTWIIVMNDTKINLCLALSKLMRQLIFCVEAMWDPVFDWHLWQLNSFLYSASMDPAYITSKQILTITVGTLLHTCCTFPPTLAKVNQSDGNSTLPQSVVPAAESGYLIYNKYIILINKKLSIFLKHKNKQCVSKSIHTPVKMMVYVI